MHTYLQGLLVSAIPARAKLLEFQAAGIGIQQAARLTHLARSTVQKIRQGQVTTISRDVSHAIMSLSQPYLARGQTVSALRAKRILRALQDEQYTKQAIAQMAGLHPEHLYNDTWSRAQSRITVATHLKILRVWEQVSTESLPPVQQ